MIKKTFTKLSSEASLLYSVLSHYKKTKHFAKLSVLSNGNSSHHPSLNCPICGSSNLHVFAKFPINLPGNQNHTLLFYDYAINNKILDGINSNEKRILDKALGFFLSLTWDFCADCKNGSLSTHFSGEHMLEYYENHYQRNKIADNLRHNTKILHGRYVSSLLPSGSNILELGAADGVTAEHLSNQGHNVYVYEPSRQFSGQLDESSSISFISDFTSSHKYFDAIYLHHVFEHIPGPVEYLKELRPLLKTGGFILIQVPDLSLQLGLLDRTCRKSIYSLFNKPYFDNNIIKNNIVSAGRPYAWFDVFANDHISAFTPEGINYILNKSGLKADEIIQSTVDRITCNPEKYAWPVDEKTGNTPNSISVIARENDST